MTQLSDFSLFFATYGSIIINILITLLVLTLLVVFLKNYIKVPPNVALIISGRRKKYKTRDEAGNEAVKDFGYRIVRGGATFVIPFFERVDMLNLGIMQVDIKTTLPVPSQEYIGVMVDGVANIKIGSDPVSIATAAEQFLGWKQDDIAAVAMQVLEGNMREIIGRMTISDLVQNRDKFAQETQRAATADMKNMGLEIVNLTVQNFSDNDGVLDTLAVKNISEKKRDADIARAEAQRDTLIHESEADQEGYRAKAEAEAQIAEQEKLLALKKAQYRAEQDKAKAIADMAYQVQQEVARKELEEERAAAELVRLQKETELQAQQVQIQREKLNIEIREKAQAERDAAQAKAEADLYKAEKEAQAKFVLAQKEAEAIRLKGEAEAKAILDKAEAMKEYGQAAILEMLVDRLPDIAKSISEPLAKTEKIILFGDGGATKMTQDVSGAMLQTFEAMKDAVGIDIPKMLKDVTTGGLIGKAISENDVIKNSLQAEDSVHGPIKETAEISENQEG